MSPDQRGQVVERFQRWQQMPPDRKLEMRRRYQRFQNLSPAQRENLIQRHERMQQKERRNAIAPEMQERRRKNR